VLGGGYTYDDDRHFVSVRDKCQLTREEEEGSVPAKIILCTVGLLLDARCWTLNFCSSTRSVDEVEG